MTSLRKTRAVTWVALTGCFCMVFGLCSFCWDKSVHVLPVLAGAVFFATVISIKERANDIREWDDKQRVAVAEQQARHIASSGLPRPELRARFDTLIAPLPLRDRITLRLKLFPNDRREIRKGKINVLQSLLDVEPASLSGELSQYQAMLRTQMSDLQTQLAKLESNAGEKSANRAVS